MSDLMPEGQFALLTLGNIRYIIQPTMSAGKFGKRLREIRLAKGIGLRELARRTGMDYSHLSRIERGLRPPPPLDQIVRLARALEINPVMLAQLGGLPEELVVGIARGKGGIENILNGQVIRTVDGLKSIRIGDTEIAAVTDIGEENEEVIIGIRPEEITLHKDSGKRWRTSARNRLQGVVKGIEPHRSYNYVTVDCGDFPLRVAVTDRSIKGLELIPGARIFVSFKAVAVKVYMKYAPQIKRKREEGESYAR